MVYVWEDKRDAPSWTCACTTVREEKVAISIDGGDEPHWSRKPQELFFRKHGEESQPMTANVPTTVGSQPGRPRAVIPLATSLWDVAPDGKRFLVVTDPDPGADSGTVRVVFNWFEELRQKISASITSRCGTLLTCPRASTGSV